MTSEKKPRVLFLYLGALRKDLFRKVAEGSEPDSQFRGYLQMRARQDMEVDFLDLYDTALVPAWMVRALPFQFVPLYHLPRVLRYDYVIASDAFLLAVAVRLANAFRFHKTKWIFLAINITVMLRRHPEGSYGRTFLTLAWKSMWHIAYLAREQRSALVSVGVPEHRLTHVPLGISTRFFEDAHGSGPGSYVLSVGRDLGRDFPTLFAAAALLPYPFIIATSPKNIPKGLSAPANVDIRYNIDIQGVKALYRDARLTCLILKGEDTTEGSDCTGQTVIYEALGARQAVVASDRLWLRGHFRPEEEYLTAPIGDAQATAAVIKRVWNDDTLRRRVGEAGYRAVTERYQTEGMADAFVGIIMKDQIHL
jgi:glycosyltransferase involved in cell wall biosynthesis